MTTILLSNIVASNLLASNDFHKPFNQILSETVVDGEVNYKAINNHPNFASYIESLKETQTFANQDEELAFLINGYNALVIQGILNGGSPSSFFGRNSFFKGDQYTIAGKNINLNDLEREVIIPIGEPRIHFAINCASSSCPKLLPEVFNAENLNQQLTQAAQDFINDPTRNKFDAATKTASISKIFDWFEEDFVKHSGSVEKYIAQYVDDQKIAEDLQKGNYKIKFLKYDWSLNGTKP
ncbi:MAG: DUF547 domain-containing protein [Gammaproteobacteria bacterium]